MTLSVVRLLSVLSNFEPIQIEAKGSREPQEVTSGKSRSDLQEQALQLRELLVERYEAGETAKELAGEFDLHHGTVRALLVQSGIKVRTRRQLSDTQLARAQQLYESGQTTTEIGEVFGVYASTIGRALVRLGVTLRPASPRALK